jgi:F-box protein 6
MEKVIDDYPSGVRCIKFYHGGTDTQFWKGHYGSKFTAASLTIEFKNEIHVEEN